MGYVEKNLVSGEEIIYKGSIHWLIYAKGILFILFGALLGILVSSLIAVPEVTTLVKSQIFLILQCSIIVIGLFLLLNAFIFVKTTELAITSKRIIAKFGFIRRNTIELNHAKIESLSVEQGIIQRIFNLGTITINGTGGNKTPMRYIAKPLDFRKEAIVAFERKD